MLCESINVGNNLSCNFASLAVSVFEGTPYHRHNKCKRGSINVVDELRVENSLKSDISLRGPGNCYCWRKNPLTASMKTSACTLLLTRYSDSNS